MQTNNDLPDELVREILARARLDIDTRLALHVEPGRVEVDEHTRSKLTAMCARRARLRRRNEELMEQELGCGCAIETILGQIGSHRQNAESRFSIGFYDLGDACIRMQMEVLETVHPEPDDPWAHLGPNTFVRRQFCCIAHSGEPCDRIIDEDGSSDEDPM